jgi:hypothetical protein
MCEKKRGMAKLLNYYNFLKCSAESRTNNQVLPGCHKSWVSRIFHPESSIIFQNLGANLPEAPIADKRR